MMMLMVMVMLMMLMMMMMMMGRGQAWGSDRLRRGLEKAKALKETNKSRKKNLFVKWNLAGTMMMMMILLKIKMRMATLMMMTIMLIMLMMMIRRPWKTERRSTEECGWYIPAWTVSQLLSLLSFQLSFYCSCCCCRRRRDSNNMVLPEQFDEPGCPEKSEKSNVDEVFLQERMRIPHWGRLM